MTALRKRISAAVWIAETEVCANSEGASKHVRQGPGYSRCACKARRQRSACCLCRGIRCLIVTHEGRDQHLIARDEMGRSGHLDVFLHRSSSRWMPLLGTRVVASE